MPPGISDSGLYTLTKMRELIRRRISMIRFPVSTTTGAETSINPEQVNRLVSDEDLNAYINSSITIRSIDIGVVDPATLADIEIINIEDGIVEYPMPEDMAFLRAVYYLPEGSDFTLVPEDMEERIQMYEVDDDLPMKEDDYGTPTYKRRLNNIVLNVAPTESKTGGLLIDYVKWLKPLVNEDDVIETQFARILQEVVMMDAAIEATITKLHVKADELISLVNRLEERMMIAVSNAHRPKVIRIASYKPVVAYRRNWR